MSRTNSSKMNINNPRVLRIIQLFSWIITLIFLTALAVAIYQAVINGNTLPLWAWLGILTLLAVIIGLGIALIVYRGVAKQSGPFDFSPTTTVNGSLITETRVVETAAASSLHAELKMIAGVFQLMAGAPGIMGDRVLTADFNYDDADWKPPEVDYAVNPLGQGSLTVRQKATNRPAMRQGRCDWVVHLNPELPTELDVQFGAGKAELILTGLKLTRLQVESGAGQLVIEFNGDWPQSLEADIKPGVGDTVLRLPKNTGIIIDSAIGLGSVHAKNLTQDGHIYTNNLYDPAGINLNINIKGGIGKLSLE